MSDNSEKTDPPVPDDPEIKKLHARKLHVEALKLEAEADKLKAETRSCNPRFAVIKYAFAGLVAGVSCFLLFSKVMTDLYALAKSRSEEASKMLESAKSKLSDAEMRTAALLKQQEELALKVKNQESEIAAAELAKRTLADANKEMNDAFAKNEKLMSDMKEEIQRRIAEVDLTTQEKRKLEEQEGILTKALDSARRSIPQRANETLGYLRIGQLDPRGYFLSGRSAISGNPSFNDLKIGQEWIVAANYNVRAALPRNDTLYHEGVVAVDQIAGGDKFVITEGPTVYFREEDRDVWVGVKKLAVAVAPTQDSPTPPILPGASGTEATDQSSNGSN